MYWPYVAVARMDFSKIYKRYGENISVLHVTPNTLTRCYSCLALLSIAIKHKQKKIAQSCASVNNNNNKEDF